MTSLRLYMVVRDGRTLVLTGPFQYPEWLVFGPGQRPEGVSFAKACQCAEAFGGRVLPVATVPFMGAFG